MTVAEETPETAKRPPSRRLVIVLLILFAITAALALTRLDSGALWDDEAQVAIIARNFNNQHRLTGWDGRNLFAYHDGTLLDRNMRPINPPLDFLITAASFRILGVSTWAARFPFVLLGLLSLVVFARLMLRISPGPGAAYAVLLMSLSTPYLLVIRSCRYYSAAIFFSLLIIDAYSALQSRRSRRHVDKVNLPIAFELTVGLVGLFFSQYLTAVSFLAGMAVAHVALYRQDFGRRGYLVFLGAFTTLLVIALPYAVKYNIWHRPDLQDGSFSLNKISFVIWHLGALMQMGCLSIPLAVYLAVQRRLPDHAIRAAAGYVIMVVCYILGLDALLPHSLIAPRYLCVLMPLGYAISGIALAALDSRRRSIAIGIAAVMTCCSITTSPNPVVLLPGYIKEISAPYPTANAAVAAYLRLHASLNDTVLVCPDYLNYPLMFYDGDRIVLTDLIDHSSPLARNPTIAGVTALQSDNGYPVWFVAMGGQKTDQIMPGGTQAWLEYLQRAHTPTGGHTIAYRYEAVANLPIFWFQCNRPEIDLHSYGPVTGVDPQSKGVVIYRRKISYQ